MCKAKTTTLPNSICNAGRRYEEHPNDCTRYVKCDVDNYVILEILTCPSGELYNPAVKKCDYSYNVKCTKGSLATTQTATIISAGEGKF